MRPLYQTQKDLDRQSKVMNFLNIHHYNDRNLYIKKNSDTDILDCNIENSEGDIVQVAEIKWRFNEKNKYPTYMISKAKFDYGISFGKPFVVFVCFDGDIWAYRHKEENLKVIKFSGGGRTDRNDSKDIELCAYIPIDLFKYGLGKIPAK